MRYSTRESEVLALPAKGMGRQNICRELHLSEGTGTTNLTHIYKKLEIHVQAKLLAIAYDTDDARWRKPPGFALNVRPGEAVMSPSSISMS